MSQDHSPAVIDATDAQIVPAQRTISASEFNREMGKIEADLPLVARRAKTHIEGLVYAIVEYGFLLLRARELHRCATVAHGSEGTFQRDEGFQGWLEKYAPDISRRTAYNYITSAENAGLTADSDPAEIQILRDRGALADTTPEKLRRKPKRHEPAAEIVQGTESAPRDFEFEWECYQAKVRKFYEEWAYFGSKCVCEDFSFVELKESEIEALQSAAHDIYRTLTEHVKKAKDRKQLNAGKKQEEKPKADRRTQPPPESDRLPDFEFEKPRGSRKLKGSRWFYGYQTPEGKIVLTVYKGKESEAEAEAFKKTLPDVNLIGPFYSTSLRYAKEKVKQVLSGKPLDTPVSEKIEGETIFVP